MRAVLQGRILSIINDSFTSKSGDTWYTTVYQVLGGYKGHPWQLEDLRTMERTYEGPPEELVKASKTGEVVTMLVDIRKPFRDGESDLAIRFLEVSPQAAGNPFVDPGSNGRSSSNSSSAAPAKAGA